MATHNAQPSELDGVHIGTCDRCESGTLYVIATGKAKCRSCSHTRSLTPQEYGDAVREQARITHGGDYFVGGNIMPGDQRTETH